MSELEILEMVLKVVGGVFVGYSVLDNMMDWIKKKATTS